MSSILSCVIYSLVYCFTLSHISGLFLRIICTLSLQFNRFGLADKFFPSSQNSIHPFLIVLKPLILLVRDVLCTAINAFLQYIYQFINTYILSGVVFNINASIWIFCWVVQTRWSFHQYYINIVYMSTLPHLLVSLDLYW